MGKIIAAVRSTNELEKAVLTEVDTVFLLGTNIEEIESQIKLKNEYKKELYVHIDLADGIGKDEYGIKYLKKIGVDGIISTKIGLIKLAKKEGLKTVQRFFIVDSHSIETTLESVSSSKADMIEIMPGLLYKVILSLSKELTQPIVAGGLIESPNEVKLALESGASAVSTGKKELW